MLKSVHYRCFNIPLIAHPHLLVWATNERFLPAMATFRSGLASKSHWLQPVLVLPVRWWPAPGGLLVGVLLKMTLLG